MTKEYMVGTLDDYPLLKVTLNGVVYFVDERDKKVFVKLSLFRTPTLDS